MYVQRFFSISTVNAVCQYWNGIGIPNGADILHHMHFPTDGSINLRNLSQALEHEIIECSLGSEVLIAALLTLKAELAHLK